MKENDLKKLNNFLFLSELSFSEVDNNPQKVISKWHELSIEPNDISIGQIEDEQYRVSKLLAYSYLELEDYKESRKWFKKLFSFLKTMDNNGKEYYQSIEGLVASNFHLGKEIFYNLRIIQKEEKKVSDFSPTLLNLKKEYERLFLKRVNKSLNIFSILYVATFVLIKYVLRIETLIEIMLLPMILLSAILIYRIFNQSRFDRYLLKINKYC